MAKIHTLSPEEIGKIAAGEVIERPANIVKELVENSIDAGATHITVYIEDGGKKLIRVIDNGCGMSCEDARLCFAHHATSKIRTLADLETLATFGFRGEALSSVASVSTVTVTTKEASAPHGVRIHLVGARPCDQTLVGSTTGTDITVSELFFNVPARKKFLKARETEERHIVNLVHALCFAYPSLNIELYCDGERIVGCPPVTSLLERSIQIWGHDFKNIMLAVTGEKPTARLFLEGIISRHEHTRYDRSCIFFFANRRAIKNHQLGQALMKGYANVLPNSRYPVAVIALTLDPVHMDVNTHPRKHEVKFLHPHRVENLVRECVSQSLDACTTRSLEGVASPIGGKIPHAGDGGGQKAVAFGYPPYTTRGARPRPHSLAIFHDGSKAINNDEPENDNRCTTMTTTAVVGHDLHDESVVDSPKTLDENVPVIVGHYKKTYILLEHDDGLLVVDQHAAHERILFERFLKGASSVDATVQCIAPVIVSINTTHRAHLDPIIDALRSCGVSSDWCGKNELMIRATPVYLKHVDFADVLMRCVGLLNDERSVNDEEHSLRMSHDVYALMACKAAIKAGDSLSVDAIRTLIRDLAQTDDKLTCPHGRPTTWLIDDYLINRKFKRDYRSTSGRSVSTDFSF